MKKILFFILSVVISLGAVSCTEKPDNGNFDVQFSVPAEATVNYADTEMSFRVQFGKAPLMTDVIVFGDPTGELKTCKITSVTEKNFTIALYKFKNVKSNLILHTAQIQIIIKILSTLCTSV